ncbi:MAG: hypothetical protein K2O16_10570 [Lachnospiraceae bacterium]|nr:hypothetical protein [Lachnospiraceae bacterium]
MIDLQRWIYSDDMADWFSQKETFTVEMQMNFICSAPHRTISEKRDGLRKLYEESGKK